MISKDHTMSYEGGFNGNVLVLSSDEEKYESAKPGSRLRIPAEVGGKK